jgi:hypothetical protein
MKTNTKNCIRCSGIGKLEQFAHWNNGICMRCGGSGVDPNPNVPARKTTKPAADLKVWVVVAEDRYGKKVILQKVNQEVAEEVAEKANALNNGTVYEAFHFDNRPKGMVCRERTSAEEAVAVEVCCR